MYVQKIQLRLDFVTDFGVNLCGFLHADTVNFVQHVKEITFIYGVLKSFNYNNSITTV